ncbi:hypothetical protein P154DRAFT_542430 [Amniculicola lignicola CBS 123094]|uniref:N-acetyltransferase domain-containing protein n=1 Tax=Amniculicola lignicola CBS 123094 TaxID=1392246 RepID=A0A6A5WYR1_9PLEO|nr:hypothetical protein P154DRAFT_542430 [Amniculicola lignicola CBS 123094]
MESLILTPRLKLTLIQSAEPHSEELSWLHELRSNKETTFWSIIRRSETIEDTLAAIKYFMPTASATSKEYRVVYAVHRDGSPTTDQGTQADYEFIGLVSFKLGGLLLPEHLVLPASAASSTLTIEIAYMFLPIAWGKGYATEAVTAALEACKRGGEFWAPYPKLYVRSVVNSENPASQRVMEKTGMVKKGVYEWEAAEGEESIFVGGMWRRRDSLWIYGQHLIE